VLAVKDPRDGDAYKAVRAATAQLEDGGSLDRVATVNMERHVWSPVEVNDMDVGNFTKVWLKPYFATDSGSNV
jgi:hypothetical protein